MASPLEPQLRPLARAAKVTEVRMRLGEAGRYLLLGLVPTLTLGAGWLLYVKLLQGYRGPGFRALMIATCVSGGATLLAIAWAFLRRYPKDAGALTLDTTGHNRDRLTSALAFARLPDDQRTPLMDAAIEDALTHAAALSPKRAVPLSPVLLSPDFAAVLMLSMLLGALSITQWSRRTLIPQAATIDAVTLTADDLDLFRDTLKELAEKDPSPETQAALQQFNQLVEDLANKRLDRAEAFRRMEALEKGLLKGREADAKALEDALKHAAEKLKDSPLSKPAGEALAKKDFKEAAKQIKELAAKLKDKQSKITEADKKRLKEALAAAAKQQKDAISRLQQQREQLRASLLAREQKAGMNDEEKRLLQRDKRELERLDREIAEKEKAQRQLDRLDRELSQAAEDLMKELGLSADDLERAAEDIDRLAREEMSEKEKEELRQRLQELRELLRQEGQGGEQLKKRLRKFAKKAKGKQGDQGEEQQKGAGKKDKGDKGDKGEKGDEDGDDGEDGDEDGEDGEGKKPGQKKGQGQEGDGEGEGQGKGKGKGKGISLRRSNRPGGSGAGDQPGQGAPMPGGGSQPGGQGTEPGGKQAGTGHDANVAGKGTSGKFGTQDVQEAATDTGQGPSVSETILSSSEKGFASRKYKRVYADYKTKAEEAMKNEDIPPGYKFYVQRYFQLIRPRD